ncbi:MAG: hypothetical protein ACYSW8_28970 [Planctomycetota bacterium]|jgi:hypothetical protein
MTDKNEMIERMSRAAMILPVSQGRVPTTVACRAGTAGAVQALGTGIDEPTAQKVGTTLPALGAFTQQAKDQLNRPLGACRTYLYTETQSYDRGRRLVMVTRIPEVLKQIAHYRELVKVNLADFLPAYEKYFEARNGLVYSGDGGSVRMLTPAKLREACYIDAGVPERIPACDLSGLALPAGLAADIATRTNAGVIARVEAVRSDAIADLLGAMDNLISKVDPNGSGERYSQALLDKAKLTCRNLRDVVESYDNDPRLLQLADLVDTQIGSIRTIDAVKTSATQKSAVLRAAKTVSKGLNDMQKSTVPATPKPATTVVTGDSLLADLLD